MADDSPARFQGPDAEAVVFDADPFLCAERDEDDGAAIAGEPPNLEEVEEELSRTLSGKGQHRFGPAGPRWDPYGSGSQGLRAEAADVHGPEALTTSTPQSRRTGPDLPPCSDKLPSCTGDHGGASTFAVRICEPFRAHPGAAAATGGQCLAELCQAYTAELLLLQENGEILAEVDAACERAKSKDRSSRLEGYATWPRLEGDHWDQVADKGGVQEEVTSSTSTASTRHSNSSINSGSSGGTRSSRRRWTLGKPGPRFLKDLAHRLLARGHRSAPA
jgi:hypothetical protein